MLDYRPFCPPTVAELTPTTHIDDRIRSVLALFIVGVALGSAAIFWDLEGSAALPYLSAMTGLIGAVAGYYFGSHRAAQADQRATNASTERDRALADLREALTRVAETTAKLQDLSAAAEQSEKLQRGAEPSGQH